MPENCPLNNVLLASRIDGQAATDLRLLLTQMLNAGTKKILCNFSHVEFISPMGVEELVKVARVAAKLGREIGICKIKSRDKELFAKMVVAHLFRFYDMEESILMVVLKELSGCFTEYEDVLDIQARMEDSVVCIEVFLAFDGDATMRQVQKTLNHLKQGIEQQIKNSRVLLIASAQPMSPIDEEVPVSDQTTDKQKTKPEQQPQLKGSTVEIKGATAKHTEAKVCMQDVLIKMEKDMK